MVEDELTKMKIDFAESILNHNQDLINFIDAKAGILLAADGAILALLASFPSTTITFFKEVVFGVAVLMVGLSALFGFLTIKPRIFTDTPSTRIFFGSITSKTRETYTGTFSSSAKEILDDYLNNIYTLALIQKKKFAYLSISLYSLFVGLVFIIIIIMFQYI